MNYFKTLIISIFTVSCALPAAAQFANSGNNAASSATPRRTVTISPYDRVSVSYVNTKLANDAKGADDISLNGVGFDYIHGFSLSKSFPLYLETGVKATLSFFSREDCEWCNIWNDDADDKDYKTTFQTLSAAIPVNLAYKFTLSNGDVSIVPYLGLNFKLNLMAKGKEVYDPEYGDKDTEKYDMFDKKDMGDKDACFKRFQMGWHIGAGLNYRQLYIGLSYGTDFMELCKKVNTSTFSVNVGYNF